MMLIIISYISMLRCSIFYSNEVYGVIVNLVFSWFEEVIGVWKDK